MADADTVKKKYPEMSAPIIALDLEAEIARAEQAVITRDLRIRHRAEMIYERGKREVVRHAGAGLAVGIGTIVLTWWLNRLSHRHDPPLNTPYTDCGKYSPRRRWSAATTTVAGIRTRQSR